MDNKEILETAKQAGFNISLGSCHVIYNNRQINVTQNLQAFASAIEERSKPKRLTKAELKRIWVQTNENPNAYANAIMDAMGDKE